MKQLNKKTSLSLSKTSHQEVVCQINHREGKTKGNPNFRLKTEVRVSDVVSSPAGTCRLVDLVSAFLLAVPNWLTSGRVMLILSFAFDLLVKTNFCSFHPQKTKISLPLPPSKNIIHIFLKNSHWNQNFKFHIVLMWLVYVHFELSQRIY